MTNDLGLGERSLAETLADLTGRVKAQPSDAKLRVFLFQLLAVTGQWDRALTQLQVAGELDPAALAMVQTYREALRCEALRRDVFAGRKTPVVFGNPEPWVARLLEAHRLAAEGNVAASQDLRDEAFEAAPAVSGRLLVAERSGDEEKAAPQTFEWLADADPRLGPMLEAVVNGRYYWIPLGNIRRVQVDKPTDLRDLVWTAVHFTWANGGEAVGLVPSRYPGTENETDDALRLARRTEWRDAGDEFFLGFGQRMFATDAGEYPLMDVRDIELNPVAPEAGEEAGAPADG